MAQARQLLTIHQWKQFGTQIGEEWQSSESNLNQSFHSLVANINSELTSQEEIELSQSLNNLRNEIPANIWRKYSQKIARKKTQQNQINIESLISDVSKEKLKILASFMPFKNQKELIEYSVVIATCLVQGDLLLKHDNLVGGLGDDDNSSKVNEYDNDRAYMKSDDSFKFDD